MKERKIGEIVNTDGKECIVEEALARGCEECVFKGRCSADSDMHCKSTDRKDGTNIIYGLTFEEKQKEIAEAKKVLEEKIIRAAKSGNDYFCHVLSLANVRNIKISDDTKKLIILHARIFYLNGKIDDINDICEKADPDSAIDNELTNKKTEAYCKYEDTIRNIIFEKMCKNIENTNFREI